MSGPEAPFESDAVVLHREEHDKLVAAAKQVDEAVDLLKRTRAEYLNYQDRAKKEREDAAKFAAVEFIREFLPALDALRDAIRSTEGNGAPPEAVEALKILDREFHRVLAKGGVERIDAAGKPFSPAEHETIGTAPVDDAAKADAVVEVVREGYRLHGRVLRPAMVRIGAIQAGGEARSSDI